MGVLVKGGKEGWVLDGEQGPKGGGDVGDAEKEFEQGGDMDGGNVDDSGMGGAKGKGRVRYRIESLRGFDFFPQTGHVEGVAILQRVYDDEEEQQ